MVKNLVLIAPTGLMSKKHAGSRGRFLMFSRIVPNIILNPFFRNFLTDDLSKRQEKDRSIHEKFFKGLFEAKIPNTNARKSVIPPLSRAYPNITVISAGLWHTRMNLGLIDSFKSTLWYGPLFDRQKAYALLGHRRTKTLVIAGSIDPWVIAHELKEDVETLLGRDKVEWKLLDGAHDTPCAKPTEIVEEIHRFWSNGSV